MAKQRKYARMGEEVKGYECCKKNCKWQGTADQKVNKKIDSYSHTLVCPKCGNDEFYGLLELQVSPTLKELLAPYGKVEVCEEKEGKFHIKITERFNINAISTFEIMQLIQKNIGDKFSVIDKLQTDINLFHYILKHKS